MNYDSGVLDIFINSKLVASFPSVVPYMSLDQIIVGEKDGIGGGIYGKENSTHLNLFFLIL